jgi:ribosome-associated heat shock protein Hsp15
MRIDKYLWCIRYFKTRSLATQACGKNSIMVNDQVVKASKEVLPGDKITLRKDQISYIIKVIAIPENRVGAKLVDLYRTDETPKEAFAHLELLKLSKAHYRKFGEGRPTKKDRRDIDNFNSDDNDEEFDF